MHSRFNSLTPHGPSARPPCFAAWPPVTLPIRNLLVASSAQPQFGTQSVVHTAASDTLRLFLTPAFAAVAGHIGSPAQPVSQAEAVALASRAISCTAAFACLRVAASQPVRDELVVTACIHNHARVLGLAVGPPSSFRLQLLADDDPTCHCLCRRRPSQAATLACTSQVGATVTCSAVWPVFVHCHASVKLAWTPKVSKPSTSRPRATPLSLPGAVL